MLAVFEYALRSDSFDFLVDCYQTFSLCPATLNGSLSIKKTFLFDSHPDDHHGCLEPFMDALRKIHTSHENQPVRSHHICLSGLAPFVAALVNT